MIREKEVNIFGVLVETVWYIGDEDVEDVRTFRWGCGPIG